MNLLILLLIILLVVALMGGGWGYGRWGVAAISPLGVIIVIILILWVIGLL